MKVNPAVICSAFHRRWIMSISRKLGVLVFFGVPAIIGGGICFAVFGSYLPVIVYEIILLLIAGGIVSR